MKKYILVILVFCNLNLIICQELLKVKENNQKHTGNFYLLWGYNRDWFAKSTIHISNVNGDPNSHNEYGVYDFYLEDVVAHDKPDFKAIKDIANLTIPQFNFRIGYYLNNARNEGWEINYDHAKYVVDDYQTMHIRGQIFGTSVDKDTLMIPSNFHYEHTDGANFWNINYMRRWNLVKSKNEKFKLNFIGKAGIGFVMPRTDIKIFGNRVNNNWKIAGICANIETGIRGELWQHFIIEFTAKAVAADYISCLVQGKGNGKASQFIKCGEIILNVGWQFGK
jgi:hypothetical protein